MSDSNFIIKVKGLDNFQIEVQTSPNMLISELKQQILLQTHIPVDRQRLLYNSKHLKNIHPLSFYNLNSSSVIQIVANLERSAEDEAVTELIRTALQIFPNSYISNRRNREQQRRPLDLTEKLESIRQNLLSIDQILNNSRNFQKFQWVDVKDTVDQWLEAQVIDVSSTQAYIHYNGWPGRWDEWIDLNSPRIQYFRTFTHQSLSSPMHSPHPATAVDPEYCKNLLPFDMNDCLLQSLTLIDKVLVFLNNLQGVSEDRVPRVLAPLLDRFGKVLSDLAGIIGSSGRMNEEDGSVASSLITNESGVSNGSGVRPPMQIPVMPPPSELALMTPRVAQDFEFHIHAFVAMQNSENDSAGFPSL